MFDTIRKRLSHKLESHQIEEDYTPRESLNHSRSNSISFDEVARNLNEVVPSYEISQLMHLNTNSNEGSHDSSDIIETNSPLPNNSRQYYSNHNDPIPNSNNISRQSSVVGFSNPDLPNENGKKRKTLKNLGLKFLNARQHFALACCRDLSLIPCILGLIQSWRRAFFDNEIRNSTSITSAKLPEHFLTGVWCFVAGYLSYSVLDGLMIRWIVTYLTSAAILRMLSMSTIIVAIEQYLVSTLSAEGYKYGLHIWILISCCLTVVYIGQNFVTLNIDLKGKQRARFFDFYNIVVFAVVPVGLASFLTMIGLLRSLLIVRLDIQNLSGE